MTQVIGGVIFWFSLSTSKVSVHEPVFIDLLVHNQLQETIKFDLGHNRKSNFEITITGPDQSVSRSLRLREEGIGRIGKISLGPSEKYAQKLLVNEWFQFINPGEYRIEIGLETTVLTDSGKAVNPVNEGNLQYLKIGNRNAAELKKICQDLTKMITISSDIEEATNAAIALSYIQDPIAVPYLENIVRKKTTAWQYAIPGLGRIADESAIEVLISIMKIQDPEEGSAQAQFVLKEIKEQIENRALREKVTAALVLYKD
jgi:hypothetical protein